MPHEANIEIVPILAATLNLLKNGQYPEKDSPSIRRVIDVLCYAIGDLEGAKLPPAKEEPVDSAPRTASAKRRPPIERPRAGLWEKHLSRAAASEPTAECVLF